MLDRRTVVPLLLWSIAVLADEPATLETSELGAAFGSSPLMWGLRLSPDGQRMVAIQAVPAGATFARVFSFVGDDPHLIIAGREDEFDVQWCEWANDTRLLCGLRAVTPLGGGINMPASRLAAVNADGTDLKVLMQEQVEDSFTQFQDNVIDWLPDDSAHVLVQLPADAGSGVAMLDIYTGKLATEDRVRERTFGWISDGHGVPRLYTYTDATERRWYVREDPESREWTLLREQALTDLDDSFAPIGFGENRDELLYYDTVDGRTALLAVDLAHNRQTRVVYAHPELDIAGVYSLGKYDRLVGAIYIDERPRIEFFDERIEQLQTSLSTSFRGKSVRIIDASWDQTIYLVLVTEDTDPGTYYRFDSADRILTSIARAYPALADRALRPMRAVRYPGSDGTAIPAYLTLPAAGASSLPAVILPHGGPSARDYWTYDYLVQYLAARGFAVLQSNYRGSDGYGRAWRGDGGFRGWRQAVGDITAGVDYLVDEGIVDPQRVCAVGWSYGGYAALMSVIEHPELFRCVASIAGVTDPRRLANSMDRFVGGRAAREFIGAGDTDVGTAGSPIERVEEIAVPVFLAHGERDVNVPFEQSQRFARQLRREDKRYEFVEYEYAEHDIRADRYRIDLLTRLGDFLGENLGN
jgi:dipeptidyl aminopeptidase/acylaminoacyl peptidase